MRRDRAANRPSRNTPGSPVTAFAYALALVALALPLIPTPAAADVTVRTLEHEADAGSHESVGFEGSVGEVTVVGVAGDTIRVEVEIRCERERDDACRRAAEDVDLRVRQRGGRIQLDIEDWPKLPNKRISLRARLEVPRRMALEVGMGVGEISVEGTESDVEVDVGVGEVSVTMRERDVRHIELDTGVGEALLRTGDRTIDRQGFVGSHLTWRDGPGDAQVEVDAGVGEIEVTLR
jgi:hypothetical protein